MAEPAICYSVDTSALIDGLERFYPADTFIGLWDAIDGLIDEERFFLSEEVFEEIKKKDAVVKGWAAPRSSKLIVESTSTITNSVTKILSAYPRMAMSGGRRNQADPFVIAVAQLKGATVVTGEATGGTKSRPKIPFICAELGIPCIAFTDLIKAEDWSFKLS